MRSLINTANSFQTIFISKIVAQEVGANLSQDRFNSLFNSLVRILFSCSSSDYVDNDVMKFWYDGNEFQATYF